MIMFGLYFTKQIPFKQVLITGLIRDHDGQKMSKSKGNVIDPIDLIEGISLEDLLAKRTSGLMLDSKKDTIEQQTRKQFPNGIPAFGEDALRFTYCALATQGRDIRFDLGRTEGYRNFCNKIWNATRFIEMQLEKLNVQHLPAGMPAIADCANEERWLIFYLNQLIAKCHKHFADYRFDLLAQDLYAFIWYEFCDKYIEKAKRKLNQGDASSKTVLQVLLNTLDQLLRLLHPIMPFVTEDIWQQSVKPVLDFSAEVSVKPLMLQSYPQVKHFSDADQALFKVRTLIDDQDILIGAINEARGALKVTPKHILKQVSVWIADTTNEQLKRKIGNLKNLDGDKESQLLICALAKTEKLNFSDFQEAPTAQTLHYKIHLDYEEEPLSEEESAARIKKAKEQIEKLIAEQIKLSAVMNNEAYLAKAPKAVIEKNAERLDEIAHLLRNIL
jgi:valyl-tRNA synthetase